MFSHLARFVTRRPLVVIAGWIAIVVALRIVAPSWDDVTLDGDLAHLPVDMPSIRGQELLKEAFPDQSAQSEIVIVIARDGQPLSGADKGFAGLLARRFDELKASGALPIVDIWTHKSDVVGPMLETTDKQAVLVMLRLENEFMATANMEVLDVVKKEVDALQAQAPEGLELGITGSAAIGGDMLTSAAESIENTETMTIVLVVVILLMVYRAPLLVFVPLLAIIASVAASTSIVAAVTQIDQIPGFEWWDIKIFKTTKVFVVVILFGAGTDYCLFLIARFKEELAKGLSRTDAVAQSLNHVGEALAASAVTTIVGLAMMYFSDFGKFSSSGPVIALCLTVTLIACVTLAPALLSAMGTWVFWPFNKSALAAMSLNERPGQGQPTSVIGRFWDRASRNILAMPGVILIAAIIVMFPFAYQGTSVGITYDLLSELRQDRVSVQGTRLLHRHFAPGETGPITILARKRNGGLDTPEGEADITSLTESLFNVSDVVAVRSFSSPIGKKKAIEQPSIFNPRDWQVRVARAMDETKAAFISQAEGYRGDVARFDVITNLDPFSHEAIEKLNDIELKLKERIQAEADSPWAGATFEFAGTTAGIRDLKAVTEHDQRLIQILVVAAVLAVLLVILRRPVVCVYLILSVLFSYFVTIGATEVFFKWLYGDSFHGLDWKVPIFLFVILIAVGEDYNIYLVTRVFEEQKKHGKREGLRIALVQTGGIITSCGIIMAGTFVSMMTGTLRGMTELGFALSLGVLLDTFVIRTVLVPAFMALLAPGEPADAKFSTAGNLVNEQATVAATRTRSNASAVGR
jgi:RND superfamily putative drug exporter